MKRLLITGGTGYLGAELVRRARASGQWDVVYTYHRTRPDDPAAHPLDLRNARSVEQLVATLRPDTIIHTAYQQSGPDLAAITADGAGHIARAAAAGGARLVHLSSDALLDGTATMPYNDDAPPHPVTLYGQAKADAERLVQQAHPRPLIIRTSLIYGGNQPGVHEQLILDVATGKRPELAFFTDEIRCPVQVTDLALALLELAVLPVSGIYNVAGADAVSRYEFARLVTAAHGILPDRLRSALSTESGMVRPRFCALNSCAAQSLVTTPLRGVRAVLGHPTGDARDDHDRRTAQPTDSGTAID